MTYQLRVGSDTTLRAAIRMYEGAGGSFARHIGSAYLVADKTNAEKVLASFHDLFLRYAAKWVVIPNEAHDFVVYHRISQVFDTGGPYIEESYAQARADFLNNLEN